MKYCAECLEPITNGRGRVLCISCVASRLKRRPGEERWEVEWCAELPVFEDGSCDIDSAKFRRNYCIDKEQAIRRAKFVLREDKFGAVKITPVRWEDQHKGTEYCGLEFRWEPTGESEEVSE